MYLGCHSINEYEDIKLFSEMGHEIVAIGAYNNPAEPGDDQRPALPDIYYNPEMAKVAATLVWDYERASVIPDELIDWCDAIYLLGRDIWLPFNWERIKKKSVIFRSHGQSIESTENLLRRYRREGLKIVRYSPFEARIPGYVGEDAMIRFYKDEQEYNGWNGQEEKVITVAQSMKKRTRALHFELFEKATRGLPRALYGTQNEDTGQIWGGKLSYEQLKKAYRDNRVFFYTGTYPAQYTMAFQEAWMTGMPVVSIGRGLAGFDLEVADFIADGVNGFTSDNLRQLYEDVKLMLKDYDYSKRISIEARKKALELFSKSKVKEEWRKFFDSL